MHEAMYSVQCTNAVQCNTKQHYSINKGFLVLKTRFTLSGLQLIFFIESSKYIYELTESAGVRIVIHDQGEKAFPDDEGIDLDPGVSTSIGLRKVLIKLNQT